MSVEIKTLCMEKSGYESVRGKEVICLNDGRIFGSSLECAKFLQN